MTVHSKGGRLDEAVRVENLTNLGRIVRPPPPDLHRPRARRGAKAEADVDTAQLPACGPLLKGGGFLDSVGRVLGGGSDSEQGLRERLLRLLARPRGK